MERVLDVYEKYTKDIEIKKHEDFGSYTLSLELSSIESYINWDDLASISHFINVRDRISINIYVNDGEPYHFNQKDNIEEQQTMLDSINKIIDKESVIKIIYIVSKEKTDSTLSVYDLELLFDYLNKQKLMHVLNILQKTLDFSILNRFEIQNEEIGNLYFYSPLIVFASQNKLSNVVENHDDVKRNVIIKNRQLYTNPQNFSKYNFIPKDFNNTAIKHQNSNKIITFFDKLKVIFAASFISNTSDIINNSNFQMGIIGHKYLEVTADFNKLNISEAHSFYSIYNWVYESAETNDKLDLARNIISRYLSYSESKWILPSDTLNSIQSAHAIYLKENVEKYIETKNKVAEITTELSIKSKDISQYFISSFKNNNLTLLTYFISIFIFNSLSDNSDKKIFSLEKYYLSMVFLLISFIYLLITRLQLFKDIKLNIRYFYSMKRIYRDIFDNKELNKLFHKRHLQYNINNIFQTMDLYTIVWIIELILLTLISIYLTFYL
ncbi:hypothetical protein [Peribacillus phoenicis]|uniref:hypothetical protein n=1 Tax=unclassified Peribacillus TaxID=2675266 RepID=UPI0039A2E02D